jgi:hypothetical protein
VEPEVSKITSLNPYERETVVNASDGDAVVRIWTAQRKFITRLRKHPAVTEVQSGFHGSTAWAEFTIPAELWNPVSGIKRARQPMSEERRAALALHLRNLRSVG